MQAAAAQVAIVAVLLLVIYLTLLRPDSGHQLPSVTAKQGREFRAHGSFPASPAQRRAAARRPEKARLARENRVRGASALSAGAFAAAGTPASGSVGADAAPLAPSPSAGPPSGGPPGNEAGRDPSEDQYGDTISRLLGQLGASE
jgi:hypothetical protein